VIAILGILSAIAIPKYLDLSDNAKRAVADANVGAINSAVALYYAQSAANGSPTFPATVTGGMFASNALPAFPSGYSYTYNAQTGVATRTP
jgi:type II secretory pathway pseudopilin PulG